MPRPEKVQAVAEIREGFRGAGAVLVTEYRGLKVKDLGELRRELAGAGARYRILKNTLVRFAVRDLEYGDLETFLEGPTAIAFCDADPVAAAKVISDFARTHPNLVLKAGVLQGRVIDTDRARALADLESREVLLARVAGAAQGPMAKAAGLMQALIRSTAVVVNAYIEKKGGAPDGAAPETPETRPQTTPEEG